MNHPTVVQNISYTTISTSRVAAAVDRGQLSFSHKHKRLFRFFRVVREQELARRFPPPLLQECRCRI